MVASRRASGLKGKTPEATVSAHNYVAARAGRVFQKVDRGPVDLIERPAPKRRRRAATAKTAAA